MAPVRKMVRLGSNDRDSESGGSEGEEERENEGGGDVGTAFISQQRKQLV